MKRRPRVGISACFFHADPQRAIFKGKPLLYLEQSISQWIQSQGALVYLIPEPIGLARAQGRAVWASESKRPDLCVSLDELSDDLDGLVLQGGADLAPESYGEKPIKPEWMGDRTRDLYELALVRAFADKKKPILGVCRGMQLLNVAYGGTLWQDIATQIPGALLHRNWDIYDRNQHTIAFEPKSVLAEWMQVRPTGGQWIATVNSVHHQGVRTLGKKVKVEARSVIDGIVEAMRVEEPGAWIYGVQWHPEFQHDTSFLSGEGLLREFLQRAGSPKSSRKKSLANKTKSKKVGQKGRNAKK